MQSEEKEEEERIKYFT